MGLGMGIELKNCYCGKKKSTPSEFLIFHGNSKWPNGSLVSANPQNPPSPNSYKLTLPHSHHFALRQGRAWCILGGSRLNKFKQSRFLLA
jgi:hypothetical protein